MTLTESISLEFAIRCNNRKLLEQYGVFPNADATVNYIIEVIKEYIGDMDKLQKVITIDRRDVPGGMPFDDIMLDLDYEWCDYAYSCGAFDTSNEDFVHICIMFGGNDKNLDNELYSTLIHELTHAYECMNRSKSEKEDVHFYKRSINDKLYFKCNEFLNNGESKDRTFRTFCVCYYRLSDFEIRAELSNLEREIKRYADNMYNEKVAEKYIKKTYLYKEFEYLNGCVDEYLKKSSYSNYISNRIIEYFGLKEYTPKVVRGIFKQMKNNLIRYEHKLNTNAAKLAYKIVNDSI